MRDARGKYKEYAGAREIFTTSLYSRRAFGIETLHAAG
jgi:hypothetical protein